MAKNTGTLCGEFWYVLLDFLQKSYKKVIVVSILLSVAILVGSLSFLIHRLFAVNNINSNGQFHQNSKVSEGVDDDSSYSSEMTDKKEKNDLEDKNSDSLAAVIEYETMQALESATYFKKLLRVQFFQIKMDITTILQMYCVKMVPVGVKMHPVTERENGSNWIYLNCKECQGYTLLMVMPELKNSMIITAKYPDYDWTFLMETVQQLICRYSKHHREKRYKT